jgi:ATP-dependent DNA helicase RecG
MIDLSTSIEYLKGVGPARADLLKKELAIFTFRDLLWTFPFRYVDKTHISPAFHNWGPIVRCPAKRHIAYPKCCRGCRKKRLVGKFRDETGVIELVWFKGVHFLQKSLLPGKEYIVYGRVNEFNRNLNIAHPEMESVGEKNRKKPPPSNQYIQALKN